MDEETAALLQVKSQTSTKGCRYYLCVAHCLHSILLGIHTNAIYFQPADSDEGMNLHMKFSCYETPNSWNSNFIGEANK